MNLLRSLDNRPFLRGLALYGMGVFALGFVPLLQGPTGLVASTDARRAEQATDITLAPATLAAWGEVLFNDTNLSANRTMACATCHAPDAALTDPRETEAGRAVSLGDDGASFGDRNTPTAAYARFSPKFGKNEKGEWRGGQFHDGRAASLADQAAGPPLNPVEMAMPSEAAVAERLGEDAIHRAALLKFAGISDPYTDPVATVNAATTAIEAFELTDTFAPFDSKYDRYLQGTYEMTDEEELGRVLFFSNQFTNCSLCHQLNEFGGAAGETFSDYRFHNIGTPANAAVRMFNGVMDIDQGLALTTGDANDLGKFKTPTLRNVAVTAPYMHNGVFNDLRTVILFYDKYNSRNPARAINPETGEPWAEPEVPQTLSLTELETGPGLQDVRIDALVAFLKTLTDARYEDLLAE
jgi:cytochrome c peroxidase